MVTSILDLNTWGLPDPTDPETAYLPSKDGNKRDIARWVLDTSLSPLDLYCYLKARFGPPNGPTMLIRHPSSNNFIQWHYTLRSGKTPIDIVGLNSRIEFSFTHMAEFSKSDQTALIENIKRDFTNHQRKLMSVRQSLEKYSLFVNPYKRLSIIIDFLQAKLEGMKLMELKLPETPSTVVSRKQVEEWRSNINRSLALFQEGASIALSLRMITPVLGESFVNLLIFVLSKPEVKNDERLYRDFTKKEIDVRIKSLYLNCEGFLKPIDASNDAFKNFHTLMHKRNDILHGNINPLNLKYDEVFFDDKIPLFAKQKNFSTRGIKENLIGLEPNDVVKDIQTVRVFIDFVLSHLSPDYRSSVEMIMNDPKPGWREDTKRVGILFSGDSELLLASE